MDVSQLDLRLYIDYTVSEIMSLDNNLGFRVTIVYDHSNVHELRDIHEWYFDRQ